MELEPIMAYLLAEKRTNRVEMREGMRTNQAKGEANLKEIKRHKNQHSQCGRQTKEKE
jgi:hypothetical protein